MVRAIMWKLSIEDDQGQSTVVQLVRSEYTIGRTEENSIRLTERNVSRRHAKLLKQGATWFLDDLGSYNGCFVNGLRVVDRHPVNASDLVQLGDYRLELLADDDVAVAASQPAHPKRADTLSTTLNLAAQTDRLVMVVGPTPGREYVLGQTPQRVGRGEECDICVNHSSVSRWHAELHYVGSSRYEIIDHDSSNGIRINGVELRQGLLDAQDLVELGDIVLKFIPAGHVYRPSPEESKQLAALLGVDLDGPEPSRMDRIRLVWRPLSRATRWGTILLGLAVVVLLALTQISHKNNLGHGADLNSQQLQPYHQALAEATKLLMQGQIIAAHDKASTIPVSSNLRQDLAFKTIETRWAEELLRKAETAPTIEERRGLLDTVAQAATVDALTRRKAADALTNLRVEAVDVAALPSSAVSAGPETVPDAAVAPDATSDGVAEATTDPPIADVTDALPPSPTKKAIKRAGASISSNSTRAPNSSTSGARGSSASTTNKSLASASAAEPNATELATSGNLESLKAARDALRRKVSAGTATDREVRLLRALCRQLGDTTCPR